MDRGLSTAFAEEITVAARVDKTLIRADQRLRFSVTIAGPLHKPPAVELTEMDGFQVISTGQSQQLQASGRRIRQALTLIYTLAPTQVGTHTLGPVKVLYEGRTYETQPIEVRVIPPASRRNPPPELERFKDPKLEGEFVL